MKGPALVFCLLCVLVPFAPSQDDGASAGRRPAARAFEFRIEGRFDLARDGRPDSLVFESTYDFELKQGAPLPKGRVELVFRRVRVRMETPKGTGRIDTAAKPMVEGAMDPRAVDALRALVLNAVLADVDDRGLLTDMRPPKAYRGAQGGKDSALDLLAECFPGLAAPGGGGAREQRISTDLFFVPLVFSAVERPAEAVPGAAAEAPSREEVRRRSGSVDLDRDRLDEVEATFGAAFRKRLAALRFDDSRFESVSRLEKPEGLPESFRAEATWRCGLPEGEGQGEELAKGRALFELRRR